LSKPNVDNAAPGFLATLESAQDTRIAQYPTLRWALLSNTTLEPLRPFLRQLSSDIHHDAHVWVGGYDTVLQDASSDECSQADVIVIALRLQVLAPALVDGFAALSDDAIQAETRRVSDYVSAAVTAVRQRSRALVLVHSLETPLYPELGTLDYRAATGQINTIRRLNLELAERLAREDGVFIIDLDAIRARLASIAAYGATRVSGSADTASLGVDPLVDQRTWHLGRVAYTRRALGAIAREYVNIVRAAKGLSKKCLVVDADGTLWGGIVGEDGIDGVRIGLAYPGSPFYDFQRALLALRARGVLLALCSKNDDALVSQLFAMRAADMPLRLDHFAAIRVNWADKAKNIAEIAAELSLGLDSIVFVDDNAFETELVQQLLPAVQTIQLPADPVHFRDALMARVDLFDTLTFSEEDRRRAEMYAVERQRRVERASMSVDDYLRGLEMEAAIDRVDDGSIARAAQLTQKTNQFNLTTRRYSEQDIRRFLASSAHDVYAVRLRDRLGDAGIVGVAVVSHEGHQSVIDTFLLSCRVLGRGLEDALLAACIRAGCERGSGGVVGLFVPTSKNGRVSDFYSSRGFAPAESGRFVRSIIEGGAPTFPAHFKSIRVDGTRVV
jgi:FkbH-like protein